MAIITEAPEPEDIIWTNLGQSKWQLYKRKAVTYGVTIVLLVASFWIIYGLSNVQYKANLSESNETADTVFSVFISLCITVTNTIIKRIFFLTQNL